MSVDQFWRFVRPARKLTGKRSFISLPTFNYAVNWSGASEIITQFNYSAVRNFVLPRTVNKPTDANFVPCIKWVDEDENVFRYKLWHHNDLVLNAPLIRQNNKIGKEFTIEIWNVNGSASVSSGDTIKIYTSLIKEITDLTSTIEEEEDTTIDEVPYSELLNTNLLSNVNPSVLDIADKFAITLEAHYVAANASVTVDNKVDAWNDESGNARHLLQAVDANRPIKLLNGFGGKNLASIKFSATDVLASAPFVNTDVFGTFYILMRVTKHVTGSYATISSNDTLQTIQFNNSSGSILTNQGVNSVIVDYNAFTPILLRVTNTLSGPTWSLNSATGPILQDIFSTSLVITPALTPPSTLALGNVANTTNFEFEIAEVIIFKETLGIGISGNCDMAIRRFLANKYEGLMEIPLIFSRDAASLITP